MVKEEKCADCAKAGRDIIVVCPICAGYQKCEGMTITEEKPILGTLQRVDRMGQNRYLLYMSDGHAYESGPFSCGENNDDR